MHDKVIDIVVLIVTHAHSAFVETEFKFGTGIASYQGKSLVLLQSVSVFCAGSLCVANSVNNFFD